MSLIPTIGLEIHAELDTESKLFCGCRNTPDDEVNSHICPVCMGYPGALPYINKGAVEKVLKVGLAVSGKIADFTEFDRKHYFYPDIPKGYQISQYENPLVAGGKILDVDITRVHLEEDTAKSIHDINEDTLIDFNRSGVPLMELVTEPNITNASQAVAFAEELQLILKTLGVSKARMERGEMRVEANISVGKKKCSGVKVEVKNLNSMKSVRRAIEYEIERQTEVIEGGGSVVQETRGIDDNTGKTFSQRAKESSHEYRYFPEPDLPKLRISEIPEWDKKVLKDSEPTLPSEKRKKYTKLGLSSDITDTLVKNIRLGGFFDEVVSLSADPKQTANFLTTDAVLYFQSDEGKFFNNISASSFSALVSLYTSKKISSRGVKDILSEMFETGSDPDTIAKEKNLFQVSDTGELKGIVEEVIAENPSVVEEYRGGKTSSLKFLVGQAMKKSKGTGNPSKLEEILKEVLG